MIRVASLICPGCENEFDLSKPGIGKELAARILGDGWVCVGCPDCNFDLATIETTPECER